MHVHGVTLIVSAISMAYAFRSQELRLNERRREVLSVQHDDLHSEAAAL
jgi:hypothetical protein